MTLSFYGYTYEVIELLQFLSNDARKYVRSHHRVVLDGFLITHKMSPLHRFPVTIGKWIVAEPTVSARWIKKSELVTLWNNHDTIQQKAKAIADKFVIDYGETCPHIKSYTLLIEKDKYVFLQHIRDKHASYSEFLVSGHALIVYLFVNASTPERVLAAEEVERHFKSLHGVFKVSEKT